MLDEIAIPTSPVHLTRLDEFAEALDYGQGVTEYQKDGMAAGRINGVVRWLNAGWL